MTRTSIRLAVAAFAIAAAGAAHANEWLIGTQPYGLTGSGENLSAATDAPRPAFPLAPVAVTGSGENISVQPLTPPGYADRGYVAVIEGSGENLSVRHIPAPRG